MELVLFIAIIINIFLIVYYRLMVAFYVQQENTTQDDGFLTMFSLPSKRDLPEAGLPYYRRYWIAVATLALLIGAGVVSRDHVFTGANLT